MERTVTFENIKLKIIDKILRIRDFELLDKINIQLNTQATEKKQSVFAWDAIKPIEQQKSLSELIETQNYKPLNKKEFLKQTKELNIQEPIDELLNALTK